MNIQSIKIILLFFLGLGLIKTNAQEVVIAAGGDSSSIEGTVAFSVGQIVYTTNTAKNGSVAQGVQQAFEISVIPEPDQEEVVDINITVSAYPNPTTDFLNLKVQNYNITNMSYQLFDMSGKLLETKKLKDDLTRIGMNNLAAAMYFVNVIQNNKKVKTFKIIKY